MWSKELKEAIDKGFEDNYCFVAFVDILGFREHVKKFINPKQEADEQILENIKSALEDALKLTKTDENRELKLIRYKVFSDCACISVPDFYSHFNDASTLCLFLVFLNGYSFQLMRRDIYLRGGLSLGFHHEEENIIFSDGLIKAYDLESKAIYPRIVIDEEVVERIKRLWINNKEVLLDFGIEKKIITDGDGITFINPFSIMKSMGRMTLEPLRKEFKNRGKSKKDFKAYTQKLDESYHKDIKRILKTNIAKYEMDNHKLQKYLWLNELLQWNRNPRRSKIKFKYLLMSK